MNPPHDKKQSPSESTESLISDDEEVTEVEPLPASEEETAETATEADPIETERDDFKDKYLRTYAELENFRKRVAKEKQDLIRFGNEKLLAAVLQIKDDLDRATAHQETADAKTLREGLAMIGRDLEKILTQFYVKPLEAVGQPFDPNYHEAMAEQETDEHPPGTVIEQYQAGYLFHDRLLRPARVAVAKKTGHSS